jgi:hypothetical protein
MPILMGGDFITQLNGAAMGDPGELLRAIGELKVGDTARMTLLRGGEPFAIEIPVLERPILPQDVNVMTTSAGASARGGGEGSRTASPGRLRF